MMLFDSNIMFTGFRPMKFLEEFYLSGFGDIFSLVTIAGLILITIKALNHSKPYRWKKLLGG